jgi:ribulose-phosphate 3-epimerase
MTVNVSGCIQHCVTHCLDIFYRRKIVFFEKVVAMILRPPKPQLAPSILSADYMRLANALSMLSHTACRTIHVDVMDGLFVPNITVGLPIVSALRKETNMNIDCHLMINDPARYAVEFVNAGADWVSIHQEADCHCHRTLNAIRLAGAKAGIALNPGTPVELLTDLIGTFDFVVLMSVNPGFGGQAFIHRAIDKIYRLDAMRTKASIPFFIQVDGGINLSNAADAVRAGADVLVAGDAVFKSDDPICAVSDFFTKIEACDKLAHSV